MLRKLTLLALFVAAGCGGQKPVEDVPATETAATTPSDNADTTSDIEEPEPDDEPGLPAPPSVDAPPPNAESSPSGLAWIVVKPAGTESDPSPTIDSTIKVHYTGWTTDGKMFDSSVVRNEPIEFPLNKLIAGWQEGIPMMKRGETRRFWIPEDLAYGKSTREDAPKGLLVFDIELIDFH